MGPSSLRDQLPLNILFLIFLLYSQLLNWSYDSANLSQQYFEQRQDRYVKVSGQAALASYYADLAGVLSRLSFDLDSSGKLTPPVDAPLPYQAPKEFSLQGI